MVANYVVDSNVWVQVDKLISDADETELDCILACKEWLNHFALSKDVLLIDRRFLILGEYYENIKQGGLAYQPLSTLQRFPRDRIIDVDIQLDADGYAVIPFDFNDPNDRKFIAVALAHEPIPPIMNATDTDWEHNKQALTVTGLQIIELCPTYIELHVK